MKDRKRILIVDDEPNIRRILQVAFEKSGYVASVAEDAHDALTQIAAERPDCVITDVTMPGISGYELQQQVASHDPELPVVIMTAFGTIPQAVRAIRDGAYEYVTKPFDLEVLKKIVASAVESEVPARKGNNRQRTRGAATFIAESPAMKLVAEMVAQVAESRATVLITGESGVGKEVVAKAIHRLSPRSEKPFVAVSCAALPETLLESELFGYEKGAFTGAQGSKLGRFEAANEGTLFLDEIGEVPLSIQVKLLRVLQEREVERLGGSKPVRVDVRLVAATNRDLQTAVEDGSFRLDLLYRLQVIELRVPPLTERPEDILPLAEHFLERFAVENARVTMRLSEDALDLMLRYRWPGNVRELENTMERAVVLADREQEELAPGLLPSHIQRAA